MTGKFISEDKKIVFALKNLKDREWNGKTYAELEEKHKRRIRNAVLNTTIIEDITSRPNVVHDIFHRLNTGGMPLTDQEIRNCVYTGVFNKQLIELNRNKNWRALLGQPNPDRRLRDAELILRFFALLKNLVNYKPSMRDFLSNYQDKNKNNTNFLSENKEIFEKTVDLIHNQIGTHAFKITTTLNKSVTDSIMVGIAQILLKGNPISDIKSSYSALITDAEYRDYVTSGTSTETRVHGRIDLARNYFSGTK
jgi:hypothetical protein